MTFSSGSCSEGWRVWTTVGCSGPGPSPGWAVGQGLGPDGVVGTRAYERDPLRPPGPSYPERRVRDVLGHHPDEYSGSGRQYHDSSTEELRTPLSTPDNPEVLRHPETGGRRRRGGVESRESHVPAPPVSAPACWSVGPDWKSTPVGRKIPSWFLVVLPRADGGWNTCSKYR